MRMPSFLRRAYDLWMKFSHVLGLIVSSILLSVFWALVIGLYGVCIRIATLFHPRESKDTYWVDSEPSTLETLPRQF